MSEEDKQEYLSIKFDLKAPNDVRNSTINTIVLLIRDIANMEDYQSWNDIGTLLLNDSIEKAKRELDNLKIGKVKDNQLINLQSN